jgi:pre-mRNA-splicing factor SYF1
VEALYGVTRTREVYGKAIESLPDEGAKNMCLEFAEVERKLGEVRGRKEKGGWGGDW